ncbi:hypothetical protein EV361DRAFT_110577 [Lentinula raphanica]|nr:hypothetical protein F5880DRAFT_1235418 [Lentinula raphanica]KAJ3972796.1 hypothetical protein EV361DRAFT_110577 [Lentinula raphanica]
MVARVSVVDYRGSVLMDTFVRPTHYVQSFRFSETNIQLSDITNAPPFDEIRNRVASLIKSKIIVGHSLWLFLSIMGLSHSALETRDLALFRPFRRKLYSSRIVDLPTLVHVYMGRNIRLGVEDSLENARACIDLFRSCEAQFEHVIHAGSWPCDLPPASYSQYLT